MSLIRFKGVKRFVAGTIAVAAFVFLVGAPSAGAATIDELQALIDDLLAQVANLQTQLTDLQGGGAVSCDFTRNLFQGVSGSDVKCLQEYLNGAGFTLASSGAGSPGNETEFFGPITRAAVVRWQDAKAASVLTPLGLAAGTGFWGPSSIAHFNTLVVAPPPPPADDDDDDVVVTPPGTGIAIAQSATQPVAALAPQSAARVPYTNFTLTASSDGDITVKSLTIERVGLLEDAAFSGIILIDQDGNQIGLERNLNSVHQAVMSSSFVIPAGTTRSFVLAGNMASSLVGQTGQIGGLSIIAVDAGSTTVSGSLPISGTQHTANSSLTIGTITAAIGTSDPGAANANLEVGRAGYIAAGIQLTIGSAEDVDLESIRWDQAGSAGSGDLGNVVINIDGTDYPTTLSSDGDFYIASISSPIRMNKGDIKQFYIKVDIDSGSGRTIDFNLDRKTDVVVRGRTFGYHITVGGGSSGSANPGGFSSNTQPFFNAYAHTVTAGTIKVEKAVSIPAQNIAINLGGEVIGGFVVEVKGEEINVSKIVFNLSAIPSAATGGSLDTNDVTSISLEDENGVIVAGPVDAVAGGVAAVTFTDTVTFPVGRTTYTLKGKMGTDFSNNDQILASTTPSSDWTTVKGQITGNDITPSPSSAVTGSTMTIKAADLTVTVSPTPVAQNMVAGSSGFHFADYVLDATASGEDIRVTSMKLQLTISTANTADDLTNCQLWNGSTAINTGGNTVDPANSVATGDDVTFTFDAGFSITKGTVTTLALKCNVRANPDGVAGTDTYAWGINDAAANVTSTGLTSTQAVTENITTAAGQDMTIQSGGTLSVTLDDSSPALKWVSAGSTDQILAVLRVTSTNEAITLSRLGLQLATSTTAADTMASNTPADLPKVTVWAGGIQVGEAIFSTSDYATATLSGVTVLKDQEVLLTLKGDIGTMVGNTLNASPGHLALVNYDASSADNEADIGLKGVGQASGNAIYAGGSDSSSNGVRIAKAIPTLTRLALTASELNLTDGSQRAIFKFKISAPSGSNGISLYKFTFDVATATQNFADFTTGKNLSTFRVTNFEAYCYSDSANTLGSCGAFDNSGLLNQGGLANASVNEDDSTSTSGNNVAVNVVPTQIDIIFNPADSTGGSTAAAVRVPAGETRYFSLKVSITGSATTSPSITAKMLGDATFASLNNAVGGGDSDLGTTNDLTAVGDNYSTGRYIFATTASQVDAWDDDDFIWSGNSTSSGMSINTYDWYNGFLLPGLPTNSTIAEVLVP